MANQGNVSNIFIPQDPVNIQLGPFTKGMILNQAGHKLPEGAVIQAKDCIAGPEGLRRRPITESYVAGTLDYLPAQGLIELWKTDGTQILVALDQKFIYEASPGAGTFTGKYWEYAVGTCSETTGTITGAGGTLWDTAASEIQVGDVFVIDANGSGDGPEESIITAITNDNTLVVTGGAAAFAGTYGGGTDYKIRRAFRSSAPYLTDYVVFGGKIIFADGSRFLYSYDGTTFTDFSSGVTAYVPRAVGFWKDRCYIGNIAEGGNIERQRVRWSGVGPTNWGTWGTDDWYDMPYTSGAIQRIIGMSDVLISYFDDCLFIGTPTAQANLPVKFRKLETGGIGLVGPHAVHGWLDGHFFVGQDNIYFINNKGYHPIGTPVVSDTIRDCENVWRIYVTPDPRNDRVVFAFPETGTTITKFWSFNYKSKAWSYDEISATAVVGSTIQDTTVTWGDLGGFTWTNISATYPTWGSMGSGAAKTRKLYFFSGSTLYRLGSGTLDATGSLVPFTFVTADLEHGLPNMKKTWMRVSLKIDRTLAAQLDFRVYSSLDRGATWTELTTDSQKLEIPVGKDEGYLNFKTTHSMARFKFVAVTATEEYVVNDTIFRVLKRGQEVLRS